MSKAKNLILRNFTMDPKAPQPASPVGATNSHVGKAANMIRQGNWDRDAALHHLGKKLNPDDMPYATALLDKHIEAMRRVPDPHASAVEAAGGKLIGIKFDRKKFDDMLAKYAPGCGSPTPVAGTGGEIPCGAKLNGEPYFCPHCPT